MSSNDILILVVEDVTKGELLNEIIDTDVKKLPDLAITRIVWVDDKDPGVESNEILSLSDGSVAYAKIYVDTKAHLMFRQQLS